MAKIKTIWGPHMVERRGHMMAWHFSGVREDGSQARWSLRFYFDSRQFKTRAMQKGASKRPNFKEEPDMFRLPEVKRAETKSGMVTPMLRARLKPEHIAEATRLALEWQRNRP